jgi:hypothetical protein
MASATCTAFPALDPYDGFDDTRAFPGMCGHMIAQAMLARRLVEATAAFG